MSKLFKFKEWLSLEESVSAISRGIGEAVTIADLHRFALEGELKFSLYFTNNVHITKGAVIAHQKIVWCMEVCPVKGIWDLEIDSNVALGAKANILSTPQNLNFDIKSSDGVLLQQGDVIGRLYKPYDIKKLFDQRLDMEEVELCRGDIAEIPMRILEHSSHIVAKKLRMDRRGNHFIPNRRLTDQGGVFVIKTLELTRFMSCLNEVPQGGENSQVEEKNPLLTLIAVLCKKSDIDWNKRGVTSALVVMTELIDAPLSDDTILRILKKINSVIPVTAKQLEAKNVVKITKSSLLILLGALCTHVNIDWNKTESSIRLLEMTELIGIPLSNDVIRIILQQIQPAIDSKSI